MMSIIAVLACQSDPAPPEVDLPAAEVPPAPATCDAGTEVWVQRVFPLLLGRRPHGAAEVRMWADFADDEGRDTAIRALAGSPEYRAWWKIVLSDLIAVSRSEIGRDADCFDRPRLSEHDGSLTRFLRTTPPESGRFGREFGMADVVIDALVADDLSTVYQANLFAKMNFTRSCGGSVEEAEQGIRLSQGEQLLLLYTDRDTSCMTCHNSEFSVTDNPDPALDRAWGVPARFEEALFGASSGPADPADFYAMSRSYGLVRNIDVDIGGEIDYDRNPWGMDDSCGEFERSPPNFDVLGHGTSFFGWEYGSAGTVWEIERTFAAGVDALAAGPLEIGDDLTVDPAQAFVYLTGQHLVDETWKLAFGKRLLLPYGLSRNRYQQERLQGYTDRFLADGWSLSELLVDITADPYFNTGLPTTCEVEPYGMLPVIDPYTVEYEGELANNGPGELVHRFAGRVLQRTLYDSLGYGEPREYFPHDQSREEDLQRSLGIFLSDGSPGFDAIDFQGLLAWEREYYLCAGPPGSSGGFLEELREAAVAEGRTVEDAALSLKDRLLARGVFEDEVERDRVRGLMAVPLTTLVSEVDPAVFERNLGLFCGVLTASPEFVLTIEPRPSGPVPTLRFDVARDCTNLVTLAAALGIEAFCAE